MLELEPSRESILPRPEDSVQLAKFSQWYPQRTTGECQGLHSSLEIAMPCLVLTKAKHNRERAARLKGFSASWCLQIPTGCMWYLEI